MSCVSGQLMWNEKKGRRSRIIQEEKGRGRTNCFTKEKEEREGGETKIRDCFVMPYVTPLQTGPTPEHDRPMRPNGGKGYVCGFVFTFGMVHLVTSRTRACRRSVEEREK